MVLYADNGDGHFDWATDPHVSGDDDDITDLEVERLYLPLRRLKDVRAPNSAAGVSMRSKRNDHVALPAALTEQ